LTINAPSNATSSSVIEVDVTYDRVIRASPSGEVDSHHESDRPNVIVPPARSDGAGSETGGTPGVRPDSGNGASAPDDALDTGQQPTHSRAILRFELDDKLGGTAELIDVKVHSTVAIQVSDDAR